MSPALIVRVTIYDEESNDERGVITQEIVAHYNGSYGYEVVALFDKLATRVALIIDPHGD